VRAKLAELSESILVPLENLISPETIRQICFEQFSPLTLEAVEARLNDFDARPWQKITTAETIFSGLVEAETPVVPVEKDSGSTEGA
jgi:ribonuclease D